MLCYALNVGGVKTVHKHFYLAPLSLAPDKTRRKMILCFLAFNDLNELPFKEREEDKEKKEKFVALCFKEKKKIVVLCFCGK